ncbi:MAG: tetratricopeptide repeat protein [Candidatus Omnitrophica bacterium]|nr:tetratricopeptide repeat protein [Candidatus Omnitrophota bacterium]
MRYPGWIKTVLSTSLAVYGLAAVVLLGAVNYKSTIVERLNAVLEWGDYPALLDAGKLGFSERSLRMAVRYYKLAAEVQPRSAQPFAMIGYCYARLGDEARAVKYYREALARNGNYFWCEYNLGMLYVRMKDLDRAVSAFQQVVSQDRDSAMKAAVLAPLSRMPAGQRQALFARAAEFAGVIRERSYRMIVIINMTRQQGTQAPELPEAATGVVLHPWSYIIQPGKEMYL